MAASTGDSASHKLPRAHDALTPSRIGSPDAVSAQLDHVFYCFDVVNSHFHRTQCPEPSFSTSVNCPLFVTWNNRGKSGLNLRGCIGATAPSQRPAAERTVAKQPSCRQVA